MSLYRRFLAATFACLLIFGLSACAAKSPGTGDVVVLFTGDVHCGIDSGFGYAGLWQIRRELEEQGCPTLLVDCGDCIQGEPVGMVSQGAVIVDLMGMLGYDAAVPGNHEFDYGTDRLLELAGEASFPYICCNFTRKEECVFLPYIIKEAGGIRIAFVGVTTPTTIVSSSPSYFKDLHGSYIYSFNVVVYITYSTSIDSDRQKHHNK